MMIFERSKLTHNLYLECNLNQRLQLKHLKKEYKIRFVKGCKPFRKDIHIRG
jgi:hypothetical protein